MDGTRPRRLPPLRIWVWTAVTLVVAAVAVLLWRTSDAAATSSTTAAAAPDVPASDLAAELTTAWSAAVTPPADRVVQDGRVLVTDEHGLAMVDPATGQEAWHYRRADATLCDATAVDGNVVAVFRGTGRCDEAVGLVAATGVRDWYRNVPFGPELELTGTGRIVLASSSTGLDTLDPTGTTLRWHRDPAADCQVVGSTVGTVGVAVLQRCGGSLQVQLLDGFSGDVVWTRDVDTGADTARIAGADQLVTVVLGDRVLVLSPADGTTLTQLSLPAGGDPLTEPLLQTGTGDVALLWARGILHALDRTTGQPRWQLPALGLPAVSADESTLTVAEDGALVQRSARDGSERARSRVAALPAGGRTALVGPVVVQATADEVRALR
ncbi:PQQ-binding-like beta-propeller repeat protein [Modestobacter muralis]|uniref:PQQ-binding-like beta-propeller repeat protein n=1 Tax=Modestobacter muralis TaxID=1608614 RepID=A0A6P0HCG1_9ACTN|nr:PQQ-binding-like beta-propeller repeat protein [Modestobacter muralis]NEK95801.1 PQQ-binding-like beta-propeller repeat protein [Modestobacter muralis]NEN52689.1 PQQ-binding-like beta-propeller repeat protein [Modestobacter muralis]